MLTKVNFSFRTSQPRKISIRNDSTDEEIKENSDNDADLDEQGDYFDVKIDEDDELALRQFMTNKPSAQKTLNDIILQKIHDKQHELSSELSETDSRAFVRKLDPRLVEMYKGVGQVLSTYRSGKLPKAFKIIPKLSNWEQVLGKNSFLKKLH